MRQNIRKTQVFISHSSLDAEAVKALNALLCQAFPPECVFNSSETTQGIVAGDAIIKTLMDKLETSSLILLVAGENYLRSPYCLFEMCLAMNSAFRERRKVIPVFQSEAVFRRFARIFGAAEDIVNVNCEKTDAVARMIGVLKDVVGPRGLGLPGRATRLARRFVNAFRTTSPAHRAFVGMDEADYAARFRFMEENDIESVTFENAFSREKVAELTESASELWVVATTGAVLVKSLQRSIEKALSNGAEVNVIVPNKGSSFALDVGDIEVEAGMDSSGNRKRLDYEFDSVVGNYLPEAYEAARKRAGDKTGRVRCMCCGTLLRLTIFLAVDKLGRIRGWTTQTLPPSRAITHSMSIGFFGRLRETGGDASGGKWSYADFIYRHCQKLREFAESRGDVMEVGRSRYDGNGFHLERPAALAYWKAKENAAHLFMLKRREQGAKSLLIEVAAQHPLEGGRLPGKEFRARLDMAVDLRRRWIRKGFDVTIYVPGSVHRVGNLEDEVSLSSAGCKYLQKCGVPRESLSGEDANAKYKGQDGVYNSADECFVASRLFLDGAFSEMLCVCSSNQIPRKTLYYIEQGVLPQFYGVSVPVMYHSMVDELFVQVEHVLMKDHDGQDPGSETFCRSRQARKSRRREAK